MRRALALVVLLPSLAHAQWATQGMLVRDEGASKGYAQAVNCTGAGVTCSTDGFTWTLHITGGGAGGASPGGASGNLQTNDGAGGFGAYGGASCAYALKTLDASGNATCSAAPSVPVPGGSGSEIQTRATATTFGAYAGSGTCSASNWMTSLSASGAQTCTRPAFSDISGTASLGQLPGIPINTLINPTGDKSFNMQDNHLSFNWVQPVVGGGFDGAIEFQAGGNYGGDLVHIHQFTGSPGVGTHLLHVEANHVNVHGIHAQHNDPTGLVLHLGGGLVQVDGVTASNAVRFTTNGMRLKLGTGTNDYFVSDGSNLSTPGSFTATGGFVGNVTGTASGNAPTAAQYWVGAADGTLSAEKDLSGFTGIVKGAAGTPSAAVAGDLPGGPYLTSVTAHNLFSATHGDTDTSAVSTDDVAVYNAGWKHLALGSCSAGGNALTYNTTTHAFGCNTSGFTATAHALFGSTHSDVDTSAVTTGDIAEWNGSQWTHMASGAAGTIFVGTGAGANPKYLTAKSAGQVLVGAGAADIAGVAVQTCTSSSSTTCTITVARSGCIPVCGLGGTANAGVWVRGSVSTTTLTCTFSTSGTTTCNCLCP